MPERYRHYRKYNVTVNDAMNDELITLVSEIEKKLKKVLEAILAEADKTRKGESLRKEWKDVADHLAFKKNQDKNGML